MKINVTINKYYIQNTASSTFDSFKNNLENDSVSYQSIQEQENEKLNNSDSNVSDNGDEIRDGVIISASLKKQIKAIHSQNNDNSYSNDTSYNSNNSYNNQNSLRTYSYNRTYNYGGLIK